MKHQERLAQMGLLWDPQDSELIEAHRWYIGGGDGKKPYVARTVQSGGKATSIYLHREIMNAPPETEVDHINGNSLDNRRCNLRLVTRRQNCWNTGPKQMLGRTSRFKGVGWNKRQNCWVVRIYDHGKKIHLGSFQHEHEAAAAYNRAAKRLFGEFAYLNPVEVQS